MLRHSLLFALTLASLFSACTFRVRATASLYVRPGHAQPVDRPCPPLVAMTEDQPESTDPRSVWVAGHFRYDNDWVWIEGTWIVSREGYTWEPPVCVVQDGNHRFHPGYFRRTEQAPPRVYREPGHIRMSCPSEDEPADVPERIVLADGVTIPANTGAGVTVPTGVNLPRGDPQANVSQAGIDQPGVVRPQARVPGTELPSADPSLPSVDRPVAELPQGQLPAGDPNLPAVERPTTTVPGGRPRLPAAGSEEQGVRCELVINRVPAGGYVNIRGSGFSAAVRVTIGGNIAEIRRQSGSEIVVRARAGVVAVHEGDNRYECGAVSLIHLPDQR